MERSIAAPGVLMARMHDVHAGFGLRATVFCTDETLVARQALTSSGHVDPWFLPLLGPKELRWVLQRFGPSPGSCGGEDGCMDI